VSNQSLRVKITVVMVVLVFITALGLGVLKLTALAATLKTWLVNS